VVHKDEMIRRNSSRRFCLGLKSDFAVMTERDAAKCEELGGRVGTRPDDAPDKFAKRWDEFQKRTMPVVDRYRREGIVHEVDGLHPITQVHRRVMEIIQQL
jgi:adenylate kinase family enzyme